MKPKILWFKNSSIIIASSSLYSSVSPKYIQTERKGAWPLVLFIEFKIFKKVHDFFKNLHDESTPFIAENIELLKEIGKLLIVGVIVGFIIGVISTLVVGTSLFVSTTGILEILAVFVAMYIFKYGYKMQKDTKGKIYSE